MPCHIYPLHSPAITQVIRRSLWYIPIQFFELESELDVSLPFFIVPRRIRTPFVLNYPLNLYSDHANGYSIDLTIGSLVEQVSGLGIGLFYKTKHKISDKLCRDLKIETRQDIADMSLDLSSVKGKNAGFEFYQNRLRQKIKCAKRYYVSDGLEIFARDDRECVDSFYGLLSKSCHGLGILPPPRKMVQQLVDAKSEICSARVYGISRCGKIVSAALIISTTSESVYAWGATDYSAAPQHANAVILDCAISDAISRDKVRFSFGLTPKTHENLIAYKKRFGAEEIPIYSYFWNRPAIDFDSYRHRRLREAAIMAIPKSFLEVCSSSIYPQIEWLNSR